MDAQRSCVRQFHSDGLGTQRYRAHARVCQVYVFEASESEGDHGNLSDEGPACRATFFDREALVPWIVERLGALALHRLQAHPSSDTLRFQLRTLESMRSAGLLSDAQATRIEFQLAASHAKFGACRAGMLVTAVR